MIDTSYIKCPLCNDCKVFHKFAISTHFKFVHKISWLKYKQDNLSKFCEVCGNKLLLETQRFCSHKCSGTFASKQVKSHKNSHSNNTLKKQYLLLDQELKNSIAYFYENNNVTKNDLTKKYNLRREFIDFIFKEKNVQVKKDSISIGLMNKNKKAKIDMFESDIAKQIVEEYKNDETASFRSLDKKYYKTYHISRKHIRQILRYYNVEFKDAKQVRKKVWQEKIARGERHPNFGKNKIINCSNTHWYFYKGMHFQGSYEFKFGLWLESKGTMFLCHEGVKIFEYIAENGRITYYHPDFYLPETDEYIEIKGYFPEEAKRKLEIIKSTHKQLKLKIYTDDILKEMSVFDIDKQMNIDIEQYRYDLKNKDFYLTSLKNKLSREDFMDKFIGESKSITKIAYELNVSKHLVYLLFTKYKIPKIGTKEFNEYKIEFLIKKFGQQIKFDFLVLCLNQKEIAEKYGISKYVLPEILKKLDLKTTVKATI
jgi:hypothetical protein